MSSPQNQVEFYSFLKGVKSDSGKAEKAAGKGQEKQDTGKKAMEGKEPSFMQWPSSILYYSYLRGALPEEAPAAAASSSAPAGEQVQQGGKKDKKKDKKKGGDADASKAAKDAREERKRQRRLERAGGAGAAVEEVKLNTVEDGVYGTLSLNQSQHARTTRKFYEVSQINRGLTGQQVWLRARLQSSRSKGKAAFLILREKAATLQAALFASKEIPKEMVKYAAGITKESIVEVFGTIGVVAGGVESCTQDDVEISISKLYTVSVAAPDMPFELADAGRSEVEFAEEGAQYVRVGQEVRLDNRWIDLRTPANNAIFRLQSAVCTLFREYLLTQDFIEIHTPKMISAVSEGGANVFKLSYFERSAFLAQSPQLYKQMAICADMERVFEIGPVFRAENSLTHRHMTEFTGLDLEMSFKESYLEVVDMIDNLMTSIFDGLNTRFAKQLKAVHQQFPFEPLVYTKPSLRLEYPQAVAMLREAGVEIGDHEDIGTEDEKLLGKIVKERYNTDFYFLLRYPSDARPFYTMPCPDDPNYTNSYDLFIRGEEITSGSQRIHDFALLEQRAKDKGVAIPTVRAYMDSFKHGCPPHGGCGIGLERVVMLFLGLHNIRRTSMFPRDPIRLTP